MKRYISTKLVEAEQMNFGEYMKDNHEWRNFEMKGYKIINPDFSTSWCPKDLFEKYAVELNINTKLPNKISIGERMVNKFIKEKHIWTLGEKTTMVRVVLKNGFEIIESSSCVDKSNYDEEIGTEICLKKIEDKIWYLLGFLLQTAIG